LSDLALTKGTRDGPTYQDHQSSCEFVYSFSARKKRGIMKRPVRKYLAECKTRVALDQLNCMLQKKIFWE